MITVTYSSVNTFRTCHRKYFYKYDMCIKPKWEGWAKLLGKVVHKGLEWLYLGRTGIVSRKEGNGASASSQAVEWPDLEGILVKMDNMFEQGGGNDGIEAEKARATARGMLKGYVRAYPANEFTKFKPEVKGEVYVVNPYLSKRGFILGFKTDGLVGKVDKALVFETKTVTTNSITDFFDSVIVDDQRHFYTLGTTLLGNCVNGVIYNGICKPRIRQGKYESDEKFCDRIEALYIKDAELPSDKREYYVRETLYTGAKEFEDWQEELRQVVFDMSQYYSYRSPQRCKDFHKDCEFRKMCEGVDCRDQFVNKKSPHEELAEEEEDTGDNDWMR